MLSLPFDPFPVLKTKRLLLRKTTEEDVNEIFFLRSDKTVLQYLGKSPETSIAQALKHIQNLEDLTNKEEGILWAITLQGNPKLIGTICLWNIAKQHYRAELGYTLHPDCQGRGIMQEALMEVLNYGRNSMKLHSVEARVDPRNKASIKLLEKNNFLKEGLFKGDYFYDGKFLDTAVYSLLFNSSSL